MKRVHDLLGLPPEYHEDGPPEYTTPPDEYNRFAPTEPPAKAGKSRMVKMLLLAVAGLSLLGVALPGLSLVLPAEPEPTPAAVSPTPAPAVAVVPEERYTVQAWHEPPSGARVTLTWEGVGESADGATGLSVPEDARVRLSYVPEVPYTMEDVSLGGVMLDGAITQTDDPLLFTVGKGGGVIHFYLQFPSDETGTMPPPIPTNEPTPRPAPDVEVVFYATSSVYHGMVTLTQGYDHGAQGDANESITSVHVRLWDETLQAAAFAYDFTPEDIEAGFYATGALDLNEFYWEHRDELANVDTHTPPYLEATMTYTDANGTEQTVTHRANPAPEMWVDLTYDDPDDDWSWMWGNASPGCFVARILIPTVESVRFTMDPNDELAPGDVFLAITVDGTPLPADGAYADVFEEVYTIDGETYKDRSLLYVMPRPDTFPEHGTAHLVLTQKLVHYDTTVTRERDYTY